MVRKRPRIEPTDDWQELLPLFWWLEQVEYERIRQPVLFGGSVAQRAQETGLSERILQRRIRSFAAEGYTRILDGLGYLTLQRFRLYAEEGLAGQQVVVWVQEDGLTVEYGGEALSCYEVECDPPAGVSSVGHPRAVKGHTLFETSIIVPQLRLFDLGEALGEEGWIKAIKLDEYAPRLPRRPDKLQQVIFPYTEAV